MISDPGREWGEEKGKGTVTSAGPEAGRRRGGRMGTKGGREMTDQIHFSQFLAEF